MHLRFSVHGYPVSPYTTPVRQRRGVGLALPYAQHLATFRFGADNLHPFYNVLYMVITFNASRDHAAVDSGVPSDKTTICKVAIGRILN